MSQSYIFLPLLAGQLFGMMQTRQLDWSLFVLVHLLGLTIQLYIVYANDYADHATDHLNETYTPFSGGSRVLVDGDLSRRALGLGGVTMAVLSLLLSGVMAAVWQLVWMPVLIFFGLSLLWMYSFEPVKLSYRGGGEVLQMLGVGVVLPWVGFYAQAGQMGAFPLETFFAILPTQIACAMATSMPDRDSDERSHKHTSSVLLGLRPVGLLVVLLNAVSWGALVWIGWGDFGRQIFTGAFVLTGVWLVLLLLSVRSFPSGPAVFRFVLLSILTSLSIMGLLSYSAAAGIPG